MSILLASAMSVVLAAPVVATAGPPTIYLALGDSLAWGDGASDPAATAYVPLFADYVAGTPHGDAKDLVNLAIGGETTATFLGAQLAAAEAVINDPATDVRVVTLSIGGNDLLNLLNEPTDACWIDPASADCQGALASGLGSVATNYPVLLTRIAVALAGDIGDEDLYLTVLYNPFGGTASSFELPVDLALVGGDFALDCTTFGNPTTTGLNDIAACIGAGFGWDVIDGYALFGDDALALTHIGDAGFNIHPNDAGYWLLFEAHRLAERD
jgi:lysophospholipase L1-like esterase